MKLLIIFALLISFVICDCCEGESNPYDDNANVCVRDYKDTIWLRYHCLEDETVLGVTFCSVCGDTLGKGSIGATAGGGALIIGMILWFCNCCMIRSTLLGYCKPDHRGEYQSIN